MREFHLNDTQQNTSYGLSKHIATKTTDDSQKEDSIFLILNGEVIPKPVKMLSA